MRLIAAATLALAWLMVAEDTEPAKRLDEAAAVFSEIMAAPDKAIKFTLGAEGSVAAGPVERTATAQTDAQISARDRKCMPPGSGL